MRSLSFCLSVALGALAVGCKPKTAVSVPSPNTLASGDVPLLKIEPGDYWTYQVRIEIPAGVTSKEAAAVDTTHERTRTFLGKVPLLKDQPEVDCFEVVAPGSPILREYVVISDDKIELLGELIMKDANSRPIVFPKPILFVQAGWKAGDMATTPPISDGGGGLLRPHPLQTIGREEVEVPAGKFRSIRIKTGAIDGNPEQSTTGGVESVQTFWFSPGTGIVKKETVRYAQGRVIVKETQEMSSKGHKPLSERPNVPGPR